MVIVNDRGATKKFPVTHWTKYVRIVADNPEESDDDSDYETDFDESDFDEASLGEEEDEIDLMLSDLQLVEPSRPVRRVSRGKAEDDSHHILEKSGPNLFQSSGTLLLELHPSETTPSKKNGS